MMSLTDQFVTQPLLNVSRRRFVKGLLGVTGSLVIGVRVAVAQSVADAAAETANDGQLNAFVAIAPDGAVTVVSHRSEMGQGVRTSLPRIVADELEARWEHVKVIQAGASELYGSQNTDGSTSVRQFFMPLRQAGAAARLMLEQAAADQWGVDIAECHARDHAVHHDGSGRSLGFGDLTSAAAKLDTPDVASLKLKSSEDFRYIGQGHPLEDGVVITTGQATYGIDTKLDGMRYAAIERPPAPGATPVNFDFKAAQEVPGVVAVQPVSSGPEGPHGFKPLGGMAVIAENTWAALQGRKALAAEWEVSGKSQSEIETELLTSARQPGTVVRARGDVDAALATAAKTVDAEYQVPMLGHACMEPPAATARVDGDSCEVWAATQAPGRTRGVVAQLLGIDAANVTVHVTLLGGGFGRKSKPDYALEAALLAKQNQRPIKVVWSREDDIRHDYFHAPSAQQLTAGLDAEGKPVAWRHRAAYPSIMGTFDPNADQPAELELGQGVINNPFAIPNMRMEACKARTPLRIGWLRSVANIQQAFAVCSFADEMAHAAGQDPRDYLLALIGEDRDIDLAEDGASNWNYGEPIEQYPFATGRLRGAIERVTAEADWGRELPTGEGLGLAAHYSFLTAVAAVVHVQADGGAVNIKGIDMAVDCGTVVNPDRVLSQLEGAAIFGISLAMFGKLELNQGQVVQSNFHDYRVARINEAPPIRVHIVASDGKPTGVGEPGVPPIAPAIANAVFAATGQRVRKLPLSDFSWV